MKDLTTTSTDQGEEGDAAEPAGSHHLPTLLERQSEALSQALSRVLEVRTVDTVGRVRGVVGTVLLASLPGAALGEVVDIEGDGVRLCAEVVGLDGSDARLMPLGSLHGVHAGARVTRQGPRLEITVGEDLLGRVLDGLGQPLDNGPPLTGERWAVMRDAPPALTRRPVDSVMATGVRVLDGLLTLGHGQRIGIFSGPGAGKSTLLRLLMRSDDVDAVVVGLVGERGREVRGFVERASQDGTLKRAVVVVAPADAPAQVRVKSAMVATSIAEYLRDHAHKRVLLCIDSMTRLARAQREVGLAAGEPPVRQGFPPSLSGVLARLVERAGNSAHGSMTAVYTVLTEAGRMDDPVADELRGVLDGHIVLSDRLAGRGHFPAVDVVRSMSRIMNNVVDPVHQAAAMRLRTIIDTYGEKRDLVDMGAYKPGQDNVLDEALEIWPELEEFLCQRPDEHTPFESTRRQIIGLAGV